MEAIPFDQLNVGDCFVIEGRNVLYMKGRVRHEKDKDGNYFYRMVELATGDIFPPPKGYCVKKEHI
jgi:hypothetical protein